jgi:hypothetical protein
VLDRSEYPNLFDPGRTAVIEDEPSSDARAGIQPPGLAHQPVGAARISSVAGRVARGRVRRLLRYTPATILLVVLLTHPAGCGRSTATTVGARRVAAASSTTTPRATRRPAERPQVARRPVVRPERRPPPVGRRSNPPLGSALRRSQAVPAASGASVAVAAADVAVPASPPARVVTTAAAPSNTTTQAAPASAPAHEGGGEFGFER